MTKKRGKLSMQIKQGNYEEVKNFKDKLLKLEKVRTTKEKNAFVCLCQQYHEDFTWKYTDLKVFYPSISQYTIKLEPGAKPVRKKSGTLNPKFESLMKKELNKIIESSIIFLIKHNLRVSKLVPVTKKNGEIWLCVDLCNLN